MKTAQADDPIRMRQTAELRLRSGTAPPARAASPPGADALALLHKLASAPATAGDALKLLHELQVHQVEIDLQHEQGAADLRELGEVLQHQAHWFEFLPFACLALDGDGTVQAVNRGGARWLATGTPDHAAEHAADHAPATPVAGSALAGWVGRFLPELLTPDSRTALLQALDQLRGGAARARCGLRLLRDAAEVDAWATLPPGAGTVLLALVPTEDDR